LPYLRYESRYHDSAKGTQTVVSMLIKRARTLPNELYKSLELKDRWLREELAGCRRIQI